MVRLTEPTTVKDQHTRAYLISLIRDLKSTFDSIISSMTAIKYDDLRFSASSINPPGSTSDPDFDTTNGGYLFDAASIELIFIEAQLPHSWREGSEILPHVHWQKTTNASGNVLWRLEYKWAPIGEVMDSSFTTLDVFSTNSGTADTNTADKHLISSFAPIDCTGKQISDMLLIRLSRQGSDALDTYGADARLLEFDIHYQVDSNGSSKPYIK